MSARLAVVVLVAQGVVLAVLLTMLHARTAVRAVQDRRWAPRLAAARTAVQSCAQHPQRCDEAAARLWRLPPALRITVLTELARTLSGAAHGRLLTLARDVGVVARATRWCRSRRWSRRLRGARLLTDLGAGREIVPMLMDDPHPAVRLQATEWVGRHADPQSVMRLLDALAGDRLLRQFAAKDSLIRGGTVTIEPLAAYLERPDPPALALALDVAVALAVPRFLPAALRHSHAADPHARALTARLLARIGGHDAVDRLAELLEDPADEVRTEATAGLGTLGHRSGASQIVAGLRDRSWMVRRAGALALLGLGGVGRLYLRRALDDPDPFAADMARQALDLPARASGGSR